MPERSEQLLYKVKHNIYYYVFVIFIQMLEFKKFRRTKIQKYGFRPTVRRVQEELGSSELAAVRVWQRKRKRWG